MSVLTSTGHKPQHTGTLFVGNLFSCVLISVFFKHFQDCKNEDLEKNSKAVLAIFSALSWDRAVVASFLSVLYALGH